MFFPKQKSYQKTEKKKIDEIQKKRLDGLLRRKYLYIISISLSILDPHKKDNELLAFDSIYVSS